MSQSFKNFLYIGISCLVAVLLVLQGSYFYTNAQSQLTPEQQKALQAELAQIEREIAEQQQILSGKQKEGVSISRDIAILDAKIKQAKLKIQAHNIAIQQLGKDITTKTKVIGTLSGQISEGKDSLSEIILETDRIDRFSLPEILLSNANFSDFFEDVGSYTSLQQSLKRFFGVVETAKAQTEEEKQNLDKKRSKEVDLRVSVEKEKKEIEKNEAEKKRLLSLNKQEQKNYQTVISDKQKKAAEIRNALFSLRDSSAIKFEIALQYANAASAKTGVRPALLLAILTQETNLGANIGSCYITGTDGNGVKIKSGVAVAGVMKATRDVQPFLEIMDKLGRDPYKTPVSCPLNIGYGGGMGPSQFIPSTWKLMEKQIAQATGKSVPDPFNPQDSFVASSVYLSNLGAANGGYTAERNAACRYYSGKSCTTQSYNGFYGDSVMKIAANIQANIDILSSSQ
jgi:membrane-bound lytic murein transglycosylase B